MHTLIDCAPPKAPTLEEPRLRSDCGMPPCLRTLMSIERQGVTLPSKHIKSPELRALGLLGMRITQHSSRYSYCLIPTSPGAFRAGQRECGSLSCSQLRAGCRSDTYEDRSNQGCSNHKSAVRVITSIIFCSSGDMIMIVIMRYGMDHALHEPLE